MTINRRNLLAAAPATMLAPVAAAAVPTPADDMDGFDLPAIRERIALAAKTLDVDASPVLSMSDQQMIESEETLDWVAENLPGVSLDWIFCGCVAGLIHAAHGLAVLRREMEAIVAKEQVTA